MDLSTTPKSSNTRRKFLSPCSSSPFRSPVIHQHAKKVTNLKENVTLEDLKTSTKELWNKNMLLEKQIHSLQEKGYSEDQLQWYIDNLHKYNEIKDIAQTLMGQIAILNETTIKKVHEEFGMTEDD